LDLEVARKFADGMGLRAQMPDGVVITGTVKTADVLAYITDRNEAEIVIDPGHVELLSEESATASYSD
jgi:hypothetical protein